MAKGLKNVLAVYKAALNPFSKQKVDVNLKKGALKSVVSAVANHPYAAAGGVTAVKALIPSAAKYVASGAAKTASIALTKRLAEGAIKKGPIGVSKYVIGTVGVGAVVAGGGLTLLKRGAKLVKKSTEALVTGTGTPEDISKVAAAAGGAVVGGVAGVVAGYLLDDNGEGKPEKKKKKKQKEKQDATPGVPSDMGSLPAPLTPVSPMAPQTEVVGRTRALSRRRKKPLDVALRQSVRINIINANQSRIGMRKYIN